MEKLMTMKVFWMAMMLGIVSGNENHATTCQLDKKEAGALCALATALEATQKVAEKYYEHSLKEASENMTRLKNNFDQSRRALLERLQELEKTNTYYTIEERMLLGVVVHEVARENDNLYRAFEEASTHFREHWNKAKVALKQALGKKGEGSSVNCNETMSTLSHFIRCHVTGGNGNTPTTVPLGKVCEDQDYLQHLKESTGDTILEIPLEAAWRRWGGLRGEQESSKRPACPSTTVLENSIFLATLHMKDLAEVAQRTEATRNQSVVSLAFLTALRRGVESGENMKKIAHDVKVAVLPGVFTAVKTNRQTTEDGRTTVILERRVQVAEMKLATIFQHYLEGSRNTTQSLNLWISVLVCLSVFAVVEIARRRTTNGPGEYNTTTAQQHPVEELSKFCVDGGTHHGGNTSEAHPKPEAVHTHREAILSRGFPCPHPLRKKTQASPEEVEKHIRDDHMDWEKPGVDEMMFVCPFCLANCDSYKIMIVHMKDGHWDEKNNYTDSAGMKCRYCEESFRSYGEVVKHIKEYHQGEPALDDDMVLQSMQFKCLQCEKTFPSNEKRRVHMRDHRKPTRAGDFHDETDQQ
ncbi:unnamed protein product [Trypanosoma congolense IL3000]|uniref:WGS project CAEQ00000000 data, annotated contig 1884 n=1 Tax=Trypanosoma congolense (strain IL3000) TaxID=1068625 RepID=F9W9Q1_TRYCI|nr:unnamed protein product [Trypanosoma congolense IL3000]